MRLTCTRGFNRPNGRREMSQVHLDHQPRLPSLLLYQTVMSEKHPNLTPPPRRPESSHLKRFLLTVFASSALGGLLLLWQSHTAQARLSAELMLRGQCPPQVAPLSVSPEKEWVRASHAQFEERPAFTRGLTTVSPPASALRTQLPTMPISKRAPKGSPKPSRQVFLVCNHSLQFSLEVASRRRF